MFEALTKDEAEALYDRLGCGYRNSIVATERLDRTARETRDNAQYWATLAETLRQAAMRQELTLLRTMISREAL